MDQRSVDLISDALPFGRFWFRLECSQSCNRVREDSKSITWLCDPLLRYRDDRGSRRGHGVYPIIDDAEPYGVGSSGLAVPAGSSWPRQGWQKSPLGVSLLGPLPDSKNAVSFSSAQTFLRGHFEIKLTANPCIARCNSRTQSAFHRHAQWAVVLVERVTAALLFAGCAPNRWCLDWYR